MGRKTTYTKKKKNYINEISKYKWKLIIVAYIILWFWVTWNDSVAAGTKIQGEWDDYTLPIVSIINSHSMNVTIDDVRQAQIMIPEWAQYMPGYKLTGIMDSKGAEIPFYTPVYSAMCVPAFLMLGPGSGHASNTFPVTNTFLIVLLMLIILIWLKASDITKLILVMAVSLNPVIFYITWPSAEVCIYAMLGISLVFWYNGWHKRSALFLSVAGMLNQTVLIAGIIMIIEYFIKLWTGRKEKESILKLIIRNIKDILLYALSFVPALLPMAYNIYEVGRINLTATAGTIKASSGIGESVFDRFVAYVFDLNYGMWPYYSVIMIVAAVLIVFAVKNKSFRYIELLVMYILNALLFSLMPHINCGMTGIARYNCWAALYMLFAVVLFTQIIMKDNSWRIVINVSIICGIISCYSIVDSYGTVNAEKTYYTYWYPKAEKMLDKHPELYNPLHSTFNSRVTHVDGGYEYETPVVYSARDGYVRKILASSKDKEYLLKSIQCGNKQEWFEKQLNKLTDKDSYISVPGKYQMVYYIQ